MMDLYHTQRPPNEIFISVDPAREDQERMARFVDGLLRAHRPVSEIGWPLEVSVRRGFLVATLTRGELQLKAEITRIQWWKPQSRRIAAMWARQIAQNLLGYHRLFADADLSGRRQIEVWRAADGSLRWEKPEGKSKRVELVLEPGIYTGIMNGNGARPLVHQYGNAEGLLPEQAAERSWIRIIGANA